MQETGWTQLLYQMAASQTLTLRQAALCLQEDAHIRALRETLAKYAGLPPEDKSALQSFYTQRLLDSSPPGTARASLERKVRMWLGEDVQSISKQGAIQLCFALGLGVEEAGTFLNRTCGEGFHWRDAGERPQGESWAGIIAVTAGPEAVSFLLRYLRDIRDEVPGEDGEREIAALWRDSPSWDQWRAHLDALIQRLEQGGV